MFILLKILRWLYAPSREQQRVLEGFEERKQIRIRNRMKNRIQNRREYAKKKTGVSDNIILKFPERRADHAIDNNRNEPSKKDF
jgi:hypothetical protein